MQSGQSWLNNYLTTSQNNQFQNNSATYYGNDYATIPTNIQIVSITNQTNVLSGTSISSGRILYETQKINAEKIVETPKIGTNGSNAFTKSDNTLIKQLLNQNTLKTT